MAWTTYALVACGSLATICLVMGGIEHFVWKKWDREQRAAHLAWLEGEVRQLRSELDAEWNDSNLLMLEIRRLRQECKVAYADGYDNGHADGYQEGERDGFFLGQDTKPQQDDCPPFGMDRFPTDLI